MRLIYHPDAEAELIAAAQFYEQRVPSLGVQFLDATDQALDAIVDAPDRWAHYRGGHSSLPYAAISVRDLLPCNFRPHSDSSS